MFIKDLINLSDIIESIDSVESTLYFSSFKKFRNFIKLIDFDLVRGSFGGGFQYHCTGLLNGSHISLTFYEFDNEIRLLQKTYSSEESDLFYKRHRGFDLPASMEYSDDGQLTTMIYYINGLEFRSDNKPLFIRYEFDSINNKKEQYLRYFPVFDYKQPNYSLYNITVSDDDEIIECNFCYNNRLVDIKNIIEFMPIIKTFKRDKLINIKLFLSEADLNLLDMALI